MKLLKKKNYLAMIENAAKGENWMFRNLYAEIDNKEVDILENGGLSCAIFVSAILYLNKLIKDIHTTVAGTEREILNSGWSETKDLRPGAVLVWEKKDFGNGAIHRHIGFYVGNDMAISNSSFDKGIPVKHHFTYNDTRKIDKILWSSYLDD